MNSTLKVVYHVNLIDAETSLNLYEQFKDYDFQNYCLKINGKNFTPSRKMCAFGDSENLSYTFSGVSIPVQKWTPSLESLKSTVEDACNCSFNYALLNLYENGTDKIGFHQDDELSLDAEAPIACVSLGATRTLQFKRDNFDTEKLHLENGSLLIMYPETNALWRHGIPAEPWITEPRISITFRKLRVTCMERSRASQPETPLSPSPKRCRLEDSFYDSTLDAFFMSLPDSFYDVPQANETIFKQELCDNIFLSCELFNNDLKIHVRKFVSSAKGLIPTTDGITMDLDTWYDFLKKLFSFNLHYSSTSFIANNAIAVLSTDEDMILKSLVSPKEIKLNQFHLDALKECVYKLNDNVIHFLLTKRLSYYVEKERRLLGLLSPDEEDRLMNTFIICIEKVLCNAFLVAFECEGCVISHPSQTRHLCMTVSDLDKYNRLGESVLLLLNIETVAKTFVDSVDFISENFLKNISVNIIKDVLFKKPY